MIDIRRLRPTDINRKLIYRAEGNTGAPEYAILKAYRKDRAIILIQGDLTHTEARANEITWDGLSELS